MKTEMTSDESMKNQAFDPQKLENQLCFPLYLASRLVTRNYQVFLEPHGITYPQYLVLLVLWEHAPCSVSTIGKRLNLNTNTLTPLLKRLENLGYATRNRSKEDERVVHIDVTEKGETLKSSCSCIPSELVKGLGFPIEKLAELKELLEEFIKAQTD